MRRVHLYFAYGSNLHPAWLEHRIGSCRPAGLATLHGHRLEFHKRGRDGSGKCDAHRSDAPGQIVHGVLYQVSLQQQLVLDRFEGRGYEPARVTVNTGDGTREATTYVARPAHIDPTAVPFAWYHALVLGGARLHRLPAAYIETIAVIPVMPDPDEARHARNMRLLGRFGTLKHPV